jgi:hypothetical protein
MKTPEQSHEDCVAMFGLSELTRPEELRGDRWGWVQDAKRVATRSYTTLEHGDRLLLSAFFEARGEEPASHQFEIVSERGIKIDGENRSMVLVDLSVSGYL